MANRWCKETAFLRYKIQGPGKEQASGRKPGFLKPESFWILNPGLFGNSSDALRTSFGITSYLRRACFGIASVIPEEHPERGRRNPEAGRERVWSDPGGCPENNRKNYEGCMDLPWTCHGLFMDFPWTFCFDLALIPRDIPDPVPCFLSSVVFTLHIIANFQYLNCLP
jgi:hypothetical protein